LSYLINPERAKRRDQADIEAERLIRGRLSERFSDWGFRAEEEPELDRIVDETLPFWLIDPNDGTSAFLRGERGASVSIALISAGRPVLGVIFAYAAPNNLGDLFSWAEGCGPLERNGQEVNSQWTKSWSDVICFVSNSADKIASAYQQTLHTSHGVARYRVAPGVAYRLALCAAGEGELALSLASPRDFDLAAGHALIIGAGGVLLDERGYDVSYNHHRPHRIGFAFAGDPTHAHYASQIDWRATFEAQRHPITPPFLRPQEVSLSADEDTLDRLQGAWWGWHIGTLLERGDMSLDLQPSELSQSRQVLTALIHLITKCSTTNRVGDLVLVTEARALCRGQAQLTELTQLPRFLKVLDEAVKTSQDQLEALLPTDPSQGVKWGLSHGRAGIPHRVVSELLSWREGEMDTWQPDGDRLIEQLSALLDLKL
jgi:fructose-1,6-bisphosphatase/inositol monophosphatase family enzyme